MHRPLTIHQAVLAGVAMLLNALPINASESRPNILFIVSEDNGEHLGCYGERRVHTPHLDALAEGGVRYTRAFVPYSVGSPSRAAFLTGLYTRQTGHIGLATHRFYMYRDFKTMPAYFQHAGYFFNCLNRLDEGVGMVLDALDATGARDNTMVVYISDHGADFPRGKGSIYEHGTRIPMIVNYPKSFPKGKVENGMVSTIDILPTMLRAARLPVPQHLPGIAFQDIDAGKVPSRKYTHTFTTGSSPNLLYMQFGIRDERYKLVYNPDRALNRLGESRYRNSKLPKDQHVQSFLYPAEYELFDLQEDPYEWINLADSAEHQEIRQRLLKAMQDFQREIKDPFASKENIWTFIAEQKEHLRKPYKKAGFRWPHLKMFEAAQEVAPVLTPEESAAEQP